MNQPKPINEDGTHDPVSYSRPYRSRHRGTRHARFWLVTIFFALAAVYAEVTLKVPAAVIERHYSIVCFALLNIWNLTLLSAICLGFNWARGTIAMVWAGEMLAAAMITPNYLETHPKFESTLLVQLAIFCGAHIFAIVMIFTRRSIRHLVQF